ncbi:MAG: ParB-like nuclease domain-containing protein [Phycisphaeraceae bacterium]|nr:ParB-like nuclease domain-containing protein [Phycisphaeraceae bacterium]
MSLTLIPIAQLRVHPANANVMPPPLFAKLAAHLERTDRYPPIIVRPLSAEEGEPVYQILDGHHRVKALAQLGRREARCLVWPVDEGEALLLLSTLNRLSGRDDPHKRAALLEELAQRRGVELETLTRDLPEDLHSLKALLALRQTPPPAPPKALADFPVAVHFFLLPQQRRRLEARLRELGESREAALMSLVDRTDGSTAPADSLRVS